MLSSSTQKCLWFRLRVDHNQNSVAIRVILLLQLTRCCCWINALLSKAGKHTFVDSKTFPEAQECFPASIDEGTDKGDMPEAAVPRFHTLSSLLH